MKAWGEMAFVFLLCVLLYKLNSYLCSVSEQEYFWTIVAITMKTGTFNRVILMTAEVARRFEGILDIGRIFEPLDISWKA